MRYSVTNATIQQVRATGAVDVRVPRHVSVVFASLNAAQVRSLQASGAVVTKVGAVKSDVMPPVPVTAEPIYTAEDLQFIMGLEELREAIVPTPYGEGFTVAILGTGIRETHEKIKGTIIHSQNYTSDPMGDAFDHETGICYIITSIAPLCSVLNMKVIGDNGVGNEEDVVLAVDDCISFWDDNPSIAPDVINLSLGGEDTGDPNNILRLACREAIAKGMWVIAAAGNNGPGAGGIATPACERYVGAVGSARFLPAERAFVVSDFSSRGPTKEGLTKPDMLFFGEDIIVASSASNTATTPRSGTSFSTPFVTGICLLYLQSSYEYGEIGRTRWADPAYPDFPRTPAGEEVSVQDMLDTYLPLVCLKPASLPAKDDDYGYGVPFGPLVAKVLRAAPSAGISGIIGPMITMMMVVMMMGAVVRPMK